MASIQKLSIRGVRSFSPDDEEQVISFCFPVTIILGANGCGKTTVIESLKYAITGSLPPGNKSGQSFVHDPKSVNQSSVKAQVKLRFANQAGSSMVVVRSMEVTQKKTTLSFKALDGILRTTDPETGERISLSHKCTELDRQIPALVGVSKAVLEHVVFCHQEESSWPLMEGAVLKKRFDEIFDSTRYARALEAIRKLRLEYASTAKDLKAELALLQGHRHAAGLCQKDLEDVSDKVEELQEKCANLDQVVKQKDTELSRLEEVRAVVSGARQKLRDAEGAVERQASVVESVREMMEDEEENENVNADDMDEVEDEVKLRQKLEEFDKEVEEEAYQLEQLEEQHDGCVADMEQCHKRLLDAKSARAKWEGEREAHRKVVEERITLVEPLVVSHDVAVPSSSSSSSTHTLDDDDDEGTQQRTQASTEGGVVGIALSTSSSHISEALRRLSSDEMDSIVMTSLRRRAEEGVEELRTLRRKNQDEDDRRQEKVNAANAELQALDSKRRQQQSRQAELRNELKQLSGSLGGGVGSRGVRTSDVEEAKAMAARASQHVEQLKGEFEGRMAKIPEEVRAWEGRVAELTRKIEVDGTLLADLRRSAEDRSAVVLMERQVADDMQRLRREAFGNDNDNNNNSNKDWANTAQMYGLVDSTDDDILLGKFDPASDRVRDRLDSCRRELEAMEKKVHDRQQEVTEARTLRNHSLDRESKLTSRVESLKQSLRTLERTISEIQKFETEHHGSSELRVSSSKDDLDRAATVRRHLEKKVKELERDGDGTSNNENSPTRIRNVLFKLKDLIDHPNPADPNGENMLACPCCKREFMDDLQMAVFFETLNTLHERIAEVDQNRADRARGSLQFYRQWMTTLAVDGRVSRDLSERNRLTDELQSLKSTVERSTAHVERGVSELEARTAERDKLRTEVDTLRGYLSEVVRLRDEADRIMTVRNRLRYKKDLLADRTAATGSIVGFGMDGLDTDYDQRDPEKVEADVAAATAEKQRLQEKIHSANLERMSLSQRLAQARARSAEAERTAAQKSERYAEDNRKNIRRQELQGQLEALGRSLAEDYGDNSTAYTTIKNTIRTLAEERRRWRDAARRDEERRATALQNFQAQLQTLDGLSKRIVAHEAEVERRARRRRQRGSADDTRHNHDDNVEALEAEIASFRQRLDTELLPQLRDKKRKVGERERYKKSIQNRLRLLDACRQQRELEAACHALRAELARLLRGNNDDEDDKGDPSQRYDACVRERNAVISEKARCEGRIGGLRDQQRELERKLKTKEYKDVNERHRLKMIETETTAIVVTDLEKYYAAVDKALLRYHGVKIEDINKIIRELWTLTYKGEDISTIELVSGQEAGSRASRSYNYRVVMTKGNGNTKMDMRGRCSAGQRVLASIVIRLALAETFCLHCGVMTLDEPTTNLDFDNKRGLAVALAQIISNRASQSNFQLVIITHDEDFVAMMKNELSSQTGFNMPERYFQVSREEGRDGSHYSRINAIDWDDI